ncbi:alcohol dehydrogenase catalytic domain-containing protein [Brevibacterium moorei]|uniref:alcohol dehydrogenase catalytic domain-containing protein n=1 Tax=Brevibacterium moorei TaxID=2968457 RepID=UPI00211D0A4E|nr:alcohol dehydrogenase catalytic domain-containing protein [Brevibacterium sp. 68QC2CO]MCQ9384864.1 alcohol dehydrogenase catalytic domain-containing protein [Brevibacterium sp. 68QC2CO]
MRAVYITSAGATPTVEDIPSPALPADGVILDVEATGLCRSDWHAWSGHDDTVHFPHVPGHEMVGRIAAVGPEVKNWSVGQRVTTPFVCGCGQCELCLGGNAQVCPTQTQPGFTHFGSWAQQVALHAADANLVAVPETLPAEAAVPLGCRFATSYHGLKNRARLRAGEIVAVFGCGGVGLSAVMIAAALDAHVIGVDISDDALALAREHGAEAVVNTRGMSVDEAAAAVVAAAGDVAAANGLTGVGTTSGPAVTVEALGLPATMNAALKSLAPLGRHVQIGLLAESPVTEVPQVIGKEIAFFGSHGIAAAGYPELMALVESGRLRPQDLVTRTIDLERACTEVVELSNGSTPGITIIRP